MKIHLSKILGPILVPFSDDSFPLAQPPTENVQREICFWKQFFSTIQFSFQTTLVLRTFS